MLRIIIIGLAFLLSFQTARTQTIEKKIGEIAPEIRLPSPNGDTIALSSLKTKVVLIDFWGSWCAPCVKEQPALSELYKKYKNSAFTCGNGFEIYGVSLDNKKKQWQSVIKKYKIDWVQVSDLLFWTSPVARDYGIQELPFNILIDGNGVIIAKNLHGDELKQAIKKLLK